MNNCAKVFRFTALLRKTFPLFRSKKPHSICSNDLMLTDRQIDSLRNAALLITCGVWICYFHLFDKLTELILINGSNDKLSRSFTVFGRISQSQVISSSFALFHRLHVIFSLTGLLKDDSNCRHSSLNVKETAYAFITCLQWLLSWLYSMAWTF